MRHPLSVQQMNVFLDFEASSLSKHSYPIEIAWVFEDGRSRSFLIKPELNWTDWSMDAQRVHGISPEMLLAEGTTAAAVVCEMMETLAGHALHASSPSWDGKWLSVLLRAGNQPRHALRLRKSDDLFADAAATIFGDRGANFDIPALVAGVIEASEPTRPAHRALPDALLELKRLRLVEDAARKAAETSAAQS